MMYSCDIPFMRLYFMAGIFCIKKAKAYFTSKNQASACLIFVIEILNYVGTLVVYMNLISMQIFTISMQIFTISEFLCS